MHVNLTGVRWPGISSLVFLLVACELVAVFPARAQEGVAGDVPVIARPKKELPKDLKTAKEAPAIRVQSALVTAPVTVIDSRGQFVYDLEEGDFQVFDNGVPQQLERFEVEQRAIAAVIVVETNSTVAPLLEQVRPLASMFSTLMLGTQGRAAVITYSDRVQVAQEFSSDSDRLDSTLRGLTARGDAARLNDALARAISLLEQRPKEERRVIVAFSEGFDTGSESTKEDVVQRATNAEVAIYGLGFSPAQALLARKPQAPPPNPLDTNVTRPLPPNTPRTPTNSENVYSMPIPVVPIIVATGEIIRSTVASSLLEFYAGYTGGVFYSHWSKKAVQDQLNRVASEIHSQYELSYVPDTLTQTGFHRIEVRVQRPKVKVRTRAGYFYQVANL
jgi:VWFA-related protein